ncbi:uncharacterized protein BDW47DRAFT_43477 [Aspergillus candidus]|uniref:Uncharacterized protein n=1 Tax=Aspergillus candidus TaxID=41067 RepID=A0A2I2FMY8_ASPCN|nr:hypothetical protein BDW47DRAFT_43477 [Aspergillus candidus]PLB41984.1 hypothetical protein BDW47DRAFT_43477 [Aspergillus candidus]
MDTESSHSQDNDFAQSPWVDMGGFHPAQQSPPLDDYHGFPYGVIPLDSAYGVTIPPPYASLPLTLPSNTWPSMLTNHQSHFPEGGLPPVPIPPSSVSPVTPIPPPRKSSTSSSTPRRTLTDEDRRRMCLYHEENKTAKQTDIGGKTRQLPCHLSPLLDQRANGLQHYSGWKEGTVHASPLGQISHV